MKILHICLTGQFNENLSYQDNLITKYHSLAGNQVTIIAPPLQLKADGSGEEFVEPGEKMINHNIKLIRLPYKHHLKFSLKFRTYVGLEKALYEVAPDFIFIHGVQFLDIKIVAKYLKKHPQVRLVADNHADYYNSASNWLSLNILHKIIWKNCAKSIEPFAEKFYGVKPIRCSFLKEVYNLPESKIELLPLGADDYRIKELNVSGLKERIRSLYGINEDDFLVTTGGKLDAIKQTDLLLEAIAHLKDKYQNLKLLYFGSVSSDLQDIFDKHTDGKTIINAGWKNTDEITEIFLASDLIVFPGRHSVLWEQAIATQVPCVFKKYKGVEHVNVNNNCIFLSQDSSKEVQNVIEELLNNKEKYDTLKDNSKIAADYFSYSNISRRAIEKIN